MNEIADSSPVSGGQHWSQQELDYALNVLLEADSTERYLGLCVLVGDHLNREAKAVHRIIWGLATRITNTKYQPGPCRNPREGDDVTFCDIQIIKWATSSHTHDKRRKDGPSTPEHLAGILGRSPEVVKDMWNQYGPARGRKGFFND